MTPVYYKVNTDAIFACAIPPSRRVKDNKKAYDDPVS